MMRNIYEGLGGQALVEFAVFGTIFLMILAALLSYGLRYGYQQEAQMKAYRAAMRIAADPNYGASSYMLIEDRHIPDPMHPFGIGSTTPIVAAASVTRTHMMDASPEDGYSLPAAIYDVQTSRDNTGAAVYERAIYKNAGFRLENNVVDSKDLLNKYQYIFGSIQARTPAGAWVALQPGGGYGAGEEPAMTCVEGHYETQGSEGSETQEWVCDRYAIDTIRITDDCAGHIVDYKTCCNTARKIVDEDFCAAECRQSCEWSSDPDCWEDCGNQCAREMTPPNQTVRGYDQAAGGAWYAANWTKEDGEYKFPVLEDLFAEAGGTKVLGLQPNTVTRSRRDTSLRKEESATDIKTTETAQWSDTTTRTFTANMNLDEDGYEIRHADEYDFIAFESREVDGVVSGEIDQTWTTDK